MANPTSNYTPEQLKSVLDDKSPGGVMSQKIIDQILRGKTGQDTQSLYQQMLAASQQQPPAIAQFAGAAGSGVSSPQTLALVNNPAASGANNVLRFAKGFADNVNASMQKPSYADLIEAKKLEIEEQKANAAGGNNGDINKLIIDLQGKYDTQTKSEQERIGSWQNVANIYSGANPEGQLKGDLASLYYLNVMKTQYPGIRFSDTGDLDPTSTAGLENGDIIKKTSAMLKLGKKALDWGEVKSLYDQARGTITNSEKNYRASRGGLEYAAKVNGLSDSDISAIMPDWYKAAPIYKKSLEPAELKRVNDLIDAIENPGDATINEFNAWKKQYKELTGVEYGK